MPASIAPLECVSTNILPRRINSCCVCVLRLLVTHSASCSRAYSGSCKDQLEYCYQNTVVGKHTFLQNTEIVVKSVHLFFKENIFEILQCFKQGISSGHCSLAMQVRLFFLMFFFSRNYWILPTHTCYNANSLNSESALFCSQYSSVRMCPIRANCVSANGQLDLSY